MCLGFLLVQGFDLGFRISSVGSCSWLLLPLRTRPPILEPVVDVRLRDLAVLRELGGDLLDLLLAWSPVAFVEYGFKNLQLRRGWRPPLP